MTRSGYSDDLGEWSLIRWRGQVASAIRGKRGQAFLRELLAALDAMPEKRLIAYDLVDTGGGVCTLGCLGATKGVDLACIDIEDPEHHDELGDAFDIAKQLVAEIEYLNDDCGRATVVDGKWHDETPEQRWTRMRAWAAERLPAPGANAP